MFDTLKFGQNKKSTRKNYLTIWRKFNSFLIKLDKKPPSWEERAALYGTYLVLIKGVKSATLKSYITAIKKTLTADGYCWNDKKVFVSALANVCRIENDTVKQRFPIKKKLLDLILFEIGRFYKNNPQPYLECLYKTIFILCYYGLLRIGEATNSQHVIKAKDIHFTNNGRTILLILFTSKTHGRESRPQKIRITGKRNYNKKVRGRNKIFCPIKQTKEYLNLRGGYLNNEEPLFVFSDRTPVEAKHVRKLLKLLLKRLQLDHKLYDTHSFRIGRASDLLKNGYSVEAIKMAGRWKSNAVYRYLRY